MEPDQDIQLEQFCQLLPADKACPTIVLADGVPLVLGRGPLTLVTDSKLSRSQVEVTADYPKQELLVRQLGANPSVAAGTSLSKSSTILLGPMASIELLEGKYKYHIHFGKKIPQDALEKLQSSNDDRDVDLGREKSPNESDLSSSTSRKRAHSQSINGEDTTSSKKLKVSKPTKPPLATRTSTRTSTRLASKATSEKSKELLASKATSENTSSVTVMNEESSIDKPKQSSLDAFFSGGSTSSGSVEMSCSWKEVDTMLILQYGNAVHCSKLACFDLDGTLIQTASGKRFATGPTDWKLFPKVYPKLHSLHGEGFRIVIFTNQLGISKGKPTKSEFKQKMESIVAKLELPILVIAATARDVYRKPAPGGWNYLVEKENGGYVVDKSVSCFVGDAAGREANWKPGTKKDFSCGDRQFAANFDLNFSTPDEYFLGQPKTQKFSWGEFIPSAFDYTKTTPILTPPSAKMHSDSQEVIIFVGCPASGKSTFYTNHLSTKGYAHVNRDKIGSWQKCVGECNKLLAAGRSVAIDNTSPDVESRKRYIDCAQKFSVPVRCFQFMTTVSHAKHNNRYREITQKSTGYVKVNDMVFNMYKSKFCEPAMSEGFAEVVQVEIAPVFKDKEKEELYRMFLASK